MTDTQQLFCCRHLTIAIHAGNSRDAIILHVESKEVMRGDVATIHDLIPRRGVADVKQTNVELPRPEERNRIERHVASHHIACRRSSLLLRSAPVLNPHALPRARIREAGDIASSKNS